MRDITTEELEEYMDFCRRSLPKDFEVEKVSMIGKVVIERGLLTAGLNRLFSDAKDQGLEPGFEMFMVSVYASAFQMGREFESRLLVKDLLQPLTPSAG